MKELTCKATSHAYTVRIGPGCLAEAPNALRELAGAARVFVAADAGVWKLHGAPFSDAGFAHVEIPPGEAAKTWEEAGRLLERLAEARADRASVLAALGGGSAGDLAGFAASVYMRGVRWAYLPTTLLAQTDACVGGKTAVDFTRAKNLAGAFHPPRIVLVDPAVLATLPDDAYVQGLAEAVKCAVLADPDLFATLETERKKILARDAGLLEWIVERCLRIKIAAVEADERDLGARRALNLGHTFGHALETASDYALGHGRAVAIGMALAVRLSRALGILEDESLPGRLSSLLAALGLPVEAPPGLVERARPFLAADKKAREGLSVFVLPARLGSVKIISVDPASLDAFLRAEAR